DLLAGPTARVFSVHFDDSVAVLQTVLRGRRSIDYRLDINAIAMRNDGDADAVEPRILILFEFLELAVRKVRRMRIERRKHSLNGGLRRFLVIDVAGVVGGNGGDGFVVVFFDLVDDAVRTLCVSGSKAAEVATAADHAAENRRRENQNGRAERETLVHPKFIVSWWRGFLEFAGDFHCQNIPHELSLSTDYADYTDVIDLRNLWIKSVWYIADEYVRTSFGHYSRLQRGSPIGKNPAGAGGLCVSKCA